MNPIKRRILIVLLSLGAVGGFASGFAHMAHAHRMHRAAFERHVADVCVEAAKRGHGPDRGAAREPPSPGAVAEPTSPGAVAEPPTE
jgi:hypothetical protein